MAAWIEYAEHLLRKHDDNSTAIEVPAKTLKAFDDIATFSARLAEDLGLDDADIPFAAGSSTHREPASTQARLA